MTANEFGNFPRDLILQNLWEKQVKLKRISTREKSDREFFWVVLFIQQIQNKKYETVWSSVI